MNVVRHFEFVCNTSKDRIKVIVPEIIDSDYGFYTWPCAPVLAQFVWYNRNKVTGKTVLELGAGTALPSLIAAKCGAKVHVSDSASRALTLQNTKKTFELNHVTDVCVHGITWGRFEEALLSLPSVDIILASDCFYDTKDFEDVIVTFAFLLERNPCADILCTYQERSSSRSIEHLIQKWNIQGSVVPLSSFEADKHNIAGSQLPGNHTIKLYIFRKSE